MCLEVLKSPVAAINRAKQRKDLNRTIMILLESSLIFAASAAMSTARIMPNMPLVIGSFLSSFSVLILFAVVLGWAAKIAAVNLGGRGDYYEGITTVTYALVPFTAGLWAISLLLYVPIIGSLLAFLAVFPTLASTLSILYRGIKELYKTDMVVALITVSITMTVFVVATVFLSGSLRPMM